MRDDNCYDYNIWRWKSEMNASLNRHYRRFFDIHYRVQTIEKMDIVSVTFLQLTIYLHISFLLQKSVGFFYPLGSHSIPSGVVTERDNLPEPTEFYEHYVKLEQPVIFRKALYDTVFPAFLNWNDSYLRSAYGDEVVEVEKGKKEDRNEDVKTMTLAEFIDVYEKEDIYMVHTLPDTMKASIRVPVSLRCRGFMKSLQELVLWFSSGGTKSVLHSDSLDNIICMLDGTKRFILIDQKYTDLIEADGFIREKSFSTVDVDAVDFSKFPKLKDVPWIQASIEKGDCLYVPYKWYHQVSSHNSRNLAVNFWFAHLWWFSTSDCDEKDLVEGSVPLQFTMSSSNEFSRSQFLELFSDMRTVTKDIFFSTLELDGESRDVQLFRFIDADEDGILSWNELYSFDIDGVVSQFPDLLGLTDDYEEETDEKTDDLTKEEHLEEGKMEL